MIPNQIHVILGQRLMCGTNASAIVTTSIDLQHLTFISKIYDDCGITLNPKFMKELFDAMSEPAIPRLAVFLYYLELFHVPTDEIFDLPFSGMDIQANQKLVCNELMILERGVSQFMLNYKNQEQLMGLFRKYGYSIVFYHSCGSLRVPLKSFAKYMANSYNSLQHERNLVEETVLVRTIDQTRAGSLGLPQVEIYRRIFRVFQAVQKTQTLLVS